VPPQRRFLGILIASLVVAGVLLSAPARSLPTYPTVTIWIHRVQALDEFDNASFPEFYYRVGIMEQGQWSWLTDTAGTGPDLIVDDNVSFSVTVQTVGIAIVLCEGDTATADDAADLSARPGGGPDDVLGRPCDVSAFSAPVYGYQGNWSLGSGSLTGDAVSEDQGFSITTGEGDGSVGRALDENDAAVWFVVSDNYNLPVADAGPDLIGVVGTALRLDGSGSRASPGSSLEQFSWDFTDDGVTESTEVVASATYSSRQTYLVRLTITDSLGFVAEDTLSVMIVNRAPTAGFEFDPRQPHVGQEVFFVDTSGDPDGALRSWAWDFGDGATSSMRDPRHAFANPGMYTVTVTVTDSEGATATAARRVDVARPLSLFEFYWVWLFLLVLLTVLLLLLWWWRRRRSDADDRALDARRY